MYFYALTDNSVTGTSTSLLANPVNEVIQERVKSLLTPSVFGQLAYYRSLGLRGRLISLPVMVAAVLMMLWRQVPSVCELTKLTGREDLFWTPKVNVSQQALSKRLLLFPAELFQRVLMDLWPTLRERWAARCRLRSCVPGRPSLAFSPWTVRRWKPCFADWMR